MLMKIFALIFGFYTLTLAIIPGVSYINGNILIANCCEEPCGEAEENKESNEDGCNNQSCSCCAVYPVESQAVPEVKRIITASLYIVNPTEAIPPSTIIEFWQPPKL